MDYLVRPAQAEDAAEIARLANALDRHEGLGGRVFSGERILRDGFGPEPQFHVLVAAMEGGGALHGYLLWHWAYDTDRARPKLWISDIFIEERARGQGLGRALLAEAEALAVRAGAGSMALAVRGENEAARRFYAAQGYGDKAVLMEKALLPLP